MQLTRLPAITYNSTAVSSLPTISFALYMLFTVRLLLQDYLAFLQSLLFHIQASSAVISPLNRILIAPSTINLYFR